MAKDFATVAKNIRKAAALKVVPAVSARIMRPAAAQIESAAKLRWPVDTGASKTGVSVKVVTTRTNARTVASNTEDYASFIRTTQNNLGGGSPVVELLVKPMRDLERDLKDPKGRTKRLIAAVIQQEIRRG